MKSLAAATQQSYLRELDRLSRRCGCSPERLESKQLRACVLMRIDEGQAPRSTNITVAARRLLCGEVLQSPQRAACLACRKVADRLPNAMEEAQVQQMLMAVLDVRCRTAMHTAAASPCA